MIAYASRTGTKSTLEKMRASGWRILIVAGAALRPEGMRYALDNGAWSCHLQGEAFHSTKFNQALEAVGSGADWIVLPDIVGGGLKSLELSLGWLDRVASFGLPLLAVQDGMKLGDVAPLVGAGLGIFLGGSTDWKLGTMREWGTLAREKNAYFHVARVNSAKRIVLCCDAGADSFDGTSVTRFGCTHRLLDLALRQGYLFPKGLEQ